MHPGERAPPEELRPPEGPLRVVAVREVEDQVGGALETRPAIDLVAGEDTGHRAAVARAPRALILEPEQALAHAPEQVLRLGGPDRSEREAPLAVHVDPPRIEDEDLGGGVHVGEALRLLGLEPEQALLAEPQVRVELTMD